MYPCVGTVTHDLWNCLGDKMRTIIQVPMEKDLLARLDQEARDQEVSRAALIRGACLRYLRELDREKRDLRYEAGYSRLPEQTSEQETRAWLAASDLPAEDWPEAPGRKS